MGHIDEWIAAVSHFDALASVETTGIPTATGVYYKPLGQSAIGPCTLIVAASDFGTYPTDGLRLSGEKVITSQSFPTIDSDSEYPLNPTVYGDSVSFGKAEYSQTTMPAGYVVSNYYEMSYSTDWRYDRGFIGIPDVCDFVMGRCNINPDVPRANAYYPHAFSSVGTVRVHLTDAVFISNITTE